VHLAKSLAIPPEMTARSKCPIAILQRSLDEQDRKALFDTMSKIQLVDPLVRRNGKNPYTIVWLCTKLNENGYNIHRKALGRHINGKCACGTL